MSATGVGEAGGKSGAGRRPLRRRTADDAAKIARHLGMIEKSRGVCTLGPGRKRSLTQGVEKPAKSNHARERARRYPDARPETTFKLAFSETATVRQLVNRHTAFSRQHAC